MAKLLIDTDVKGIKIKKIAKAVCKTLNQTALLKAELVKADAEYMQNLNKETRGIDKVTDVLSYPSLDGIRGKVLTPEEYPTVLDGKRLFIGSIVLCDEKIIEQAKEYGHTVERETTYLTVHGLMHLFGYDHMTEEDKAEMREKEKKALRLLGIEQ